uniref:Putative ovule protein n=1 Tax=Solanum chacoense TaxID=4108 RepID=A0A0V0GMK1_SOLCH
MLQLCKRSIAQHSEYNHYQGCNSCESNCTKENDKCKAELDTRCPCLMQPKRKLSNSICIHSYIVHDLTTRMHHLSSIG